MVTHKVRFLFIHYYILSLPIVDESFGYRRGDMEEHRNLRFYIVKSMWTFIPPFPELNPPEDRR